MLTKGEIIQCFPTCLWVHEVTDHETFNRELTAEIAKLREAAPRPTGPAVAWQSPPQLHTLPGFRALADTALTAAQSVLKFLKCEYDECYVTDCWANVNRQGHAHTMHTHPNNYLSGVYYVQVPPNSGRLVFADPRPQASAITPKLSENTPFNSNEMYFEPAPGKLVLFHAWLPHFVEVNRSDRERISIAFNVMLKGHLGTDMASAEV